MGFVNHFNVNIYNHCINSILNNQKNYSSAAQKYKHVHLIMVRVLIRVLISLWSTKPVFPSSTRHWYLDVLSKLNMSKAKDTTSRTKLFIFLHHFIFLQSSPFLVLPFSVMGIPTHSIAPPGQLKLSFPLCQVPTPGIIPTTSYSGLPLPSTVPGVDYFMSLLSFICNIAIVFSLVFLSSVWSPSTHHLSKTQITSYPDFPLLTNFKNSAWLLA